MSPKRQLSTVGQRSIHAAHREQWRVGNILHVYQRHRPRPAAESQVGLQPNDVILEWTQSSFLPFALTRNQMAVAKDLNLAATSTSTSTVALIKFLDNLSDVTNGLPAAFSLISPEELTAMYTAAFAGMDAQGERFLKRVNELRADYRDLYLNAYNATRRRVTKPRHRRPTRLHRSSSDIFAKTLDNPWSVYMDGGGEFVDVPGTPTPRVTICPAVISRSASTGGSTSSCGGRGHHLRRSTVGLTAVAHRHGQLSW